MSDSKNQSLLARVEAKGFAGIDQRQTVTQKLSTSDICNFRLMNDGSLQKRCGFAPLLTAPDAVRAIWTGETDSGYGGYLLCGATLYRMDLDQPMLQEIGGVGTQEGDADMFWFCDRLYLLDGKEFYSVSDNRLQVVQGYVPLYGDGWQSGMVGSICQPLNLLTRRARIRYRMEESPSIYLCTAHPIESLDAVIINGVHHDPHNFTINESYHTVNVPGLSVGDEVELFVTYDGSVARQSDLKSNVRGTVYGGIANSRVFFWGGARANVMYTSGAVLRKDFEHILSVYEDADMLYVPDQGDFFVGDGRYAITALGRHYDRLLIFTEGQTWMANSEEWETEAFPVMRINSSVGCSVRDGVALCGNDPICIFGNGVYRFHTHTDMPDECNATCISSPISLRMSALQNQNVALFANNYHRQIFFYSKEDTSGQILVYDMDGDIWYRYEGIEADFFFSTERGVGFVQGRELYRMEDVRTKDLDALGNERSIVATWRSNLTDFGLPYDSKRMLGIDVEGDFYGDPFEVSFGSDGSMHGSYIQNGTCRTDPNRVRRRLRSARFDRLFIQLQSSAQTPQSFMGIVLEAKK